MQWKLDNRDRFGRASGIAISEILGCLRFALARLLAQCHGDRVTISDASQFLDVVVLTHHASVGCVAGRGPFFRSEFRSPILRELPPPALASAILDVVSR